MKAIILGCSHAAGSLMEREPGRDRTDFEFGYRNSFPVLVAKALGYQPCNFAIPGGSNDAMFRIFVEQLATINQSDIVIACWTGCDRSEIWHDIENIWLPLAQGIDKFRPMQLGQYALAGKFVGGDIALADKYFDYKQQWEKYHCHLKANQMNKIKNIQALNVIAQSRKIKVINIDTFMPVGCVDNINWTVDKVFCDWANATNQPHTDCGHYFLPTHQAFANVILTAYSHTV